MSKVLSGALVLILLVALLCYFTNTSFNLKAYADNLDNLPNKPTLPNFEYVNGSFSNVESIGDFASAVGGFFSFLFDCVAYPFEWIVYIVKVVFVLTNGMIVGG